MADKAVETPLMKQYYSFKAKYPDAMLLFRVGDFYETYGEDAVKSSKILGIIHRGKNAALNIRNAHPRVLIGLVTEGVIFFSVNLFFFVFQGAAAQKRRSKRGSADQKNCGCRQ